MSKWLGISVRNAQELAKQLKTAGKEGISETDVDNMTLDKTEITSELVRSQKAHWIEIKGMSYLVSDEL